MATQIIWTKELYGTGDDTVDTQHQELFKRINAVFASMEKGEKKEEVSIYMASLAEYAKSHFSCEEGIMKRKKCQSEAINKTAHCHFLKEFERLNGEFQIGGATINLQQSLKNMLTSWLRSHIMTIDAKLKDVTA